MMWRKDSQTRRIVTRAERQIRVAWGGRQMPLPCWLYWQWQDCLCVTDGGGKHPNSAPQSASPHPQTVLPLPQKVPFSTTGINPSFLCEEPPPVMSPQLWAAFIPSIFMRSHLQVWTRPGGWRQHQHTHTHSFCWRADCARTHGRCDYRSQAEPVVLML